MCHSHSNAGDPAPAFELPTSKGGTARLADYAGKVAGPVLLPEGRHRGLHPGGSRVQRHAVAIHAKGAALLGISRDSLADHKAFAKKHALKVALGSDEDGTVCNAYGVWAEKQLYGRKFMGIVRSTFLIGPDGLIRRVWRNVRVPGMPKRCWTNSPPGDVTILAPVMLD